MLEDAGVLRTWRLHAAPDEETFIIAEPLADHRLAYLDYEGPVSGGRGEVARWDRGVYTLTDESPRQIACELRGVRLAGSIVLTTDVDPPGWRFCYSSAKDPSEGHARKSAR